MWRNIDSSWSLMTAWKKLVFTSLVFHQESQQYLQGDSCHSKALHKVQPLSSVKLLEDPFDQLVEQESLEDFDAESTMDPDDTEEVLWIDQLDDEMYVAQQEHFYDFSDMLDEDAESDDMGECPLSQKSGSLASLEEMVHTNSELMDYQAIRRHSKKSLRVCVNILGRGIMALVDRGTASCFIQTPLVKRLRLWREVSLSSQEIQ